MPEYLAYHEIEAGYADQRVLLIYGAHTQEQVRAMLFVWADYHNHQEPLSYLIAHGARCPWWQMDWEERYSMCDAARADIVH